METGEAEPMAEAAETLTEGAAVAEKEGYTGLGTVK